MEKSFVISNSRYPNRILSEFSQTNETYQSISVDAFQKALAENVFRVFQDDIKDYFSRRDHLCQLDSWLERKFTEESNRTVHLLEKRKQLKEKLIVAPTVEADDYVLLTRALQECAETYAESAEWEGWITKLTKTALPLEPEVMKLLWKLTGNKADGSHNILIESSLRKYCPHLVNRCLHMLFLSTDFFERTPANRDDPFRSAFDRFTYWFFGDLIFDLFDIDYVSDYEDMQCYYGEKKQLVSQFSQILGGRATHMSKPLGFKAILAVFLLLSCNTVSQHKDPLYNIVETTLPDPLCIHMLFDEQGRKTVKKLACKVMNSMQASSKDHKLLLFTNVAESLNAVINSKHPSHTTTFNQFNDFKNAYDLDVYVNEKDESERRKHADRICAAAEDYIRTVEGIDVTIKPHHLPQKRVHTARELLFVAARNFETEYIEKLKTDIFYASFVDNENYTALRESLHFNAPHLSEDAWIEYTKIEQRIMDNFNNLRSADPLSPACIPYTSSSLIRSLCGYAWSNLNASFGPSPSHALPDEHQVFFRKRGILDSANRFVKQRTALLCAAVGFSMEYESRSDAEYLAAFRFILDKFIEKEDCRGAKSHFDYCSNRFVTFGYVALLYAPYQRKVHIVRSLCDYIKRSTAAKDRSQSQTLIILINALLGSSQFSVDEELTHKMLLTCFDRCLYPRQMGMVSSVLNDPFSAHILSKYFHELDTPSVLDGQSPFFIYVHSNIICAQALKKQPRHSPCYLTLAFESNQKLIRWATPGVFPQEPHDVYRLVLLIQAITWRLANSDRHSLIKIDSNIYQKLIDICLERLQAIIAKEAIDGDDMKMIRASAFIMTAMANSMRYNQVPTTDGNAEQDQLAKVFTKPEAIQLAVYADFLQRKYNRAYRAYIADDTPTADFWLISGPIRYISELQGYLKPTAYPNSLPSIADRDLYIESLHKEFHSNPRFFVLLARLLEFSKFYGDSNLPRLQAHDLELLHMDPSNHTEWFLPYDRIGTYLTEVRKRRDAPQAFINVSDNSYRCSLISCLEALHMMRAVPATDRTALADDDHSERQ